MNLEGKHKVAKLVLAVVGAIFTMTMFIVVVTLPSDQNASVNKAVFSSLEDADSYTPASEGTSPQWRWDATKVKVVISQMEYRSSLHHTKLKCTPEAPGSVDLHFTGPRTGEQTTCVLTRGRTEIVVPLVQDGSTVRATAYTTTPSDPLTTLQTRTS